MDFVKRHPLLVGLLSFVSIGLPQYIESIWSLVDKIKEQEITVPEISWVLYITAPLGLFLIGLIYLQTRSKEGRLRKTIKSDVNDTIQLLQAETLVLKSNSGEERPYSFAQVLLAIADELTVGISLNSFESRILDGLTLGLGQGWYLPHEDKGATHLIGVLVQNALVERYSEEYQHMVQDYDPDIIGLKTSRYLSKGTETKYHLSPLGSKVVQQLHQQSTPATKGSEEK